MFAHLFLQSGVSKLDSNPIIGVDVSAFSHPVTGIGRYTIEVIRRLTNNKEVNWILYSNHRFKEFEHLQSSNVAYKYLPFNFKYSRLIWSQIILPFLLARDRVNLFWCSTHRIPRLFLNDIAVMVTIHDMNWKLVPSTMKYFSMMTDAFFMPYSVKRSSKIITVSNSTASDVCAEFPEVAGKISTIHLGKTGLYESEIVLENLDHNFSNQKYILFVGTLEPRKNLVRLLEAFSLLPKAIKKEVKLIVVGGVGWGMDSIDLICSKLKIANDVHILGFVSDSQLEVLYQKALFLAIPSLYEGFGLPIVEAMKYGVPSLTSNLSSMPEIAGDASIQVNPHNVDSIKEGLIDMLSNKDILMRLRGCAEKRHLQFDWDITAKKTMDSLLDVLHSN